MSQTIEMRITHRDKENNHHYDGSEEKLWQHSRQWSSSNHIFAKLYWTQTMLTEFCLSSFFFFLLTSFRFSWCFVSFSGKREYVLENMHRETLYLLKFNASKLTVFFASLFVEFSAFLLFFDYYFACSPFDYFARCIASFSSTRHSHIDR